PVTRIGQAACIDNEVEGCLVGLLQFLCFADRPHAESDTLSLHDALPISFPLRSNVINIHAGVHDSRVLLRPMQNPGSEVPGYQLDRKSTRLNSSHRTISYAVVCVKQQRRSTRHSAFVLLLSRTPTHAQIE